MCNSTLEPLMSSFPSCYKWPCPGLEVLEDRAQVSGLPGQLPSSHLRRHFTESSGACNTWLSVCTCSSPSIRVEISEWKFEGPRLWDQFFPKTEKLWRAPSQGLCLQLVQLVGSVCNILANTGCRTVTFALWVCCADWLTPNLSDSSEEPNHVVGRAAAVAKACPIPWMSQSHPHHPCTWEKGHFPTSLMTSVVARRPKAYWIYKKEVITEVNEKSRDMTTFGLNFIRALKTEGLLLSLRCVLSHVWPIFRQTLLHVERMGSMSRLNILSAQVQREHIPALSAQFLWFSSALGGSQSHCYHVTMSGKHTQRTTWDEDEEGFVLHTEMEVQQSEEG